MYKDSTYRDKFIQLRMWMPAIAEAVKKELRNELSNTGAEFTKKHFASKNTAKLTAEELGEGFLSAIEGEDHGEAIGEFVANSWLLKNTDLYDFFEGELKKISVNVEEIECIESSKAKDISEAAVEQFGAKKSYLFSVMNSVVFPKEIFENLEKRAHQDVKDQESQKTQKEEALTLEKVRVNAETQVARLKDKYEKKLSGLEKKYLQDVASLKKQISSLQKQLQAKC